MCLFRHVAKWFFCSPCQFSRCGWNLNFQKVFFKKWYKLEVLKSFLFSIFSQKVVWTWIFQKVFGFSFFSRSGMNLIFSKKISREVVWTWILQKVFGFTISLKKWYILAFFKMFFKRSGMNLNFSKSGWIFPILLKRPLTVISNFTLRLPGVDFKTFEKSLN